MYEFIAIKEEHAPLIHQWKSEPYMIQMALDESSKSTVQLQLADIQRTIKNTSSQYHLIQWNKQLIGYIRIDWMDDDQSCAWLRFALGERRNQGHMTKALHHYIGQMIHRGCHRIEAEVYGYNTPSIRLLRRLGFQQEGIKRQAHIYQQQYYDIFVFGLLRTDFNH